MAPAAAGSRRRRVRRTAAGGGGAVVAGGGAGWWRGAPAARSLAARLRRCAGARRPARAAAAGRGGPPTGPNQCHDITVYPDVGLAGGACAGLGLLLDIREATHPIRIDFVGDPNMSFWHSATFSNDGKKVLFSDEWGGGSAPRCRDTDKLRVGRQRALHHREQQDGVQELLQDAGGADQPGELRRAQRIADSDPGPRGHGAGVVPGRHLGVRLDRRRPSRSRSPTSIAAR